MRPARAVDEGIELPTLHLLDLADSSDGIVSIRPLGPADIDADLAAKDDKQLS